MNKQMVCPKAKECKEYCARKEPHICNIGCRNWEEGENCPACVEVPQPTPTLREQMPLITVRQVMVDAFLLLPYSTQIDTTDNEQMIRILDLLENEVVAWYRAKLEEIAEGLAFKCENCGIENAGICDGHECVNIQLAMCQEAILKQREGI